MLSFTNDAKFETEYGTIKIIYHFSLNDVNLIVLFIGIFNVQNASAKYQFPCMN